MTEQQRVKSIFWATSVFVALCTGGIVYAVYNNNDMRMQFFLEIFEPKQPLSINIPHFKEPNCPRFCKNEDCKKGQATCYTRNTD